MSEETTGAGGAFEAFVAEHRRLDDSFGRFLGAAAARDVEAARTAIEDFDRALREHTALEERRVYPPSPDGKLLASAGEESSSRLARELLLEHVQIRELSGMILRRLSEASDLEGAMRLAGSLARRWDAHTAREEREIFLSAG
jgi:hypothetical protein